MRRMMALLLVGCMVGVSVVRGPAYAGEEPVAAAPSAALGEAKALYALQRFDRARKAFAALAKGGNAQAAFRLALMLETGEGGPADPEAALRWLHVAARAGYEPACRELAARRGLARESLVCGREEETGDLLLHEAEAGDVKAMLLLARAKAAARDGRAPDLEGAVVWLQRAAARGDARIRAYVAEALARICAQPAAPSSCRQAADPPEVTPPPAGAADAGR